MIDRLLFPAAGAILLVVLVPTLPTLIGALGAWLIILGLEVYRENA